MTLERTPGENLECAEDSVNGGQSVLSKYSTPLHLLLLFSIEPRTDSINTASLVRLAKLVKVPP